MAQTITNNKETKENFTNNILQHDSLLYESVVGEIFKYLPYDYQIYDSILTCSEKKEFIYKFCQDKNILFENLCDFEKCMEYHTFEEMKPMIDEVCEIDDWIDKKHPINVEEYKNAYHIWGYAIFMIKHKLSLINSDEYLNFIIEKGKRFESNYNVKIAVNNVEELIRDLNFDESHNLYKQSIILEKYFGETLLAVGL